MVADPKPIRLPKSRDASTRTGTAMLGGVMSMVTWRQCPQTDSGC
jgi:hypothetical protein